MGIAAIMLCLAGVVALLVALRGSDAARAGGGCDCDGSDDYGVDPIDDGDDSDERGDLCHED